MKVLFIGGTGIISSACSALALEKGIDLYHLNRGKSNAIRPVHGVKQIIADIRNEDETRAALAGHSFDAVVEWIAFTPEHIEADIHLFKDICKQFVFISTATVYETPPQHLPIKETTKLSNPVWQYSQNKIRCEEIICKAQEEQNFTFTIVRPSHTYDKTLIPMDGGYTILDRMLQGKEVIVHGDGSSLWTLTHHADFAKGLVGLLGNPKAMNEDFHITSDEWLSWEQINNIMAKALGVEAKIVHIPSDFIAPFDKDFGDSLLGDKTFSKIFDNSKIKSAVPEFVCTTTFEQGAIEIVNWYKADASRQIVDQNTNTLHDTIIQSYRKK